MLDGTQITVALIAAVFSGGGGLKLIEGVINSRSGRFERERAQNADILRMRDQALEEARRSERERREQDQENRKDRERLEDEHRIEKRNLEAELRVISFHAQLLTRMLLDYGCPPEKIPIWPIPPR